ncbi:MAG: UDP-N-acetylmuramate--L-alanine ligase [Alistipes sp.]|nr:UDP-N-acetylmuramate--L-alanine ligase [Alistipes sp.]
MEKKNYYFLGIGGIGMSALARYFLHEGCRVAGYDRTESPLTRQLVAEGAEIHYEESVEAIPAAMRDAATTIVVYTPAVPTEHAEYQYFLQHGFTIEKRSQMLGHLSEGHYVMAVAGTHGKTTTSTLTAWLNLALTEGGSAFLGGISKNFESNLYLGERGNRLAVEADEFDRSFLRLQPDVAVITSADADHLDIYGTHEAVKEAFSQFVDRIKVGGALVLKQGVDVAVNNRDITLYRYAYDTPSDFYATHIRLEEGGHYRFDLVMPDRTVQDCTLGIPGWVNIENAVAAVAMCWVAARREGVAFDEERLRWGLAHFQGVKRRFEFYVNTPTQVYMDDYAHHPRELSAALTSVRGMFPGRRIMAIFQPHLYTRTRDLYREFAEALSQADEVVLLPIYPAREEPIEGVCSEMIAAEVTIPCRIVEREALAEWLREVPTDVVITFGAGNIDACCGAVAEVLSGKVLGSEPHDMKSE